MNLYMRQKLLVFVHLEFYSREETRSSPIIWVSEILESPLQMQGELVQRTMPLEI